MSLSDVQEIPRKSLILVTGAPGAGKSDFCDQVVLNRLAVDRPVLFVTTERAPSEIVARLQERGMGRLPASPLHFVDAFSQTVGVVVPERTDAIPANCMDLNSISIATTRLQERMGHQEILLACDSLTSPYLFSGAEVVKFLRLFLSRFAAEGNSVVALIDEGCGRAEDLVAMQSVADGVITVETEDSARIISVVKHPELGPAKIEVPAVPTPVFDLQRMDPRMVAGLTEWLCTAQPGKPIRTEVPDFVHLLWLNLATWSGMLWDPKRFPAIAYEACKQMEHTALELLSSHLPWHRRLLMKSVVPQSFSEVKDMRRFSSRFLEPGSKGEGLAIWDYVADASKTDEHRFRLYESASCWGFDDVGARLACAVCGATAGMLKAFEKEERDWNVVETECVGLGSPYCELKAAPGEPDELRDFLQAIDRPAVEKVHDRLMDQLVGFLVHGQPLAERPRLGSGVWLILLSDVTTIPALFSERYRMALRMGGAKVGKEVGEHLIEAGVTGDEAIGRVIEFMAHCNVGKITHRPGPSTAVLSASLETGGTGSGPVLSETLRIRENCEALGLDTGEPSCFFTTAFLNGLFSAVKEQHVREVKCIAAGDPYCEWEIV
ncbi:MAG: ATPase domain-containing protein [Anaerolineae bacterium]|jgi:predicted hydrocarbon binding protein/KaiC/GvpD/RAD55 family RecA-like ATPase